MAFDLINGMTFALLDGENPIRVWRRNRNLTLQKLTDMPAVPHAGCSISTGGYRHDPFVQ